MMTRKHAPPRQRIRVQTLNAEDVARIWTEETRKRKPDAPAIRRSTVWSYLKESRPTVGEKPGRYADNPVPTPLPGRSYLWLADQEPELRQWWNGRLGQGHGLTARGRRKQDTP